jgi:hypothetical protein
MLASQPPMGRAAAKPIALPLHQHVVKDVTSLPRTETVRRAFPTPFAKPPVVTRRHARQILGSDMRGRRPQAGKDTKGSGRPTTSAKRQLPGVALLDAVRGEVAPAFVDETRGRGFDRRFEMS